MVAMVGSIVLGVALMTLWIGVVERNPSGALRGAATGLAFALGASYGWWCLEMAIERAGPVIEYDAAGEVRVDHCGEGDS